MTNIEDPDEISNKAAFHQGLHYFNMTKAIFRERKIQLYLEIKNGDISAYTIDHSKFIASNQKEEFKLVHEGLKLITDVVSFLITIEI